MAGSAQRKQDEGIEPEITPNFTSIQGGGKSTPGRANLRAVDKAEKNPESPTNPDETVGNRESQAPGASNVIQGPWADRTTPQAVTAKLPGRFKKRKGLIIGAAGLGILSLPILLLILFFPLKFEMMTSNITSIASSIPQYAAGERLEYLITRALAVRLLMSVNNNSEADGKLVFCKGGGIACSLFATYNAQYFEKKLGISITATANGVSRLGGKAQNWDVTVTRGDGANVETVQERINKNSDMRKFIKKEVLEKGAQYNVLTRYLARKILMKKFGVTLFRGPAKLEEAKNRVTNAKANIKANIVKGTIGKISPRLAIYLSCLQDANLCAKLRTKLVSALPEVKEPDPDSDNYEQEKRDYDQYKSSKAILDGSALTESEASGPIKKLITKKVLTAAGGVGLAVGVVDLIMSAVHSINDGALEKIWYDMATQVYTGFSTEVQVINDKLKLNELDADTIAAAFSMFDNAELSPLYQAENGLEVDTSEGITTECNGPSGLKVSTQLTKGELVCIDQKVVRDYTSSLTSNPAFASLATVADYWVNSVGFIIDVAGDAIGAILEAIPPIKALLDLAGGAIAPVIDWLLGLIFEPPEVGFEASGPDNYIGLSAGLRVEQNALMEEGVDDDGTAMGGGGALLSTDQASTILGFHLQDEKDEFNSQSALAKIFGTESRFSFINQLAARMPVSFASLARLPFSSFSTLLRGSSASAVNANAINPFGLPLYGYAPGDPALTADPGTYTEAYCKSSAEARLASFSSEPGKIETYKVSDPCALEKMVVGTALNAEGVYDDQYSLKYPKLGNDSIATGEVVLPVNKGYRAFYSDSDFGPRTCIGCSSWHKGLDFQMPLGSPVYAAADGTVTAAGGSNPSCTTGDLAPNNTVGIKLANGVIIQYLHMNMNDITVKIGDSVTAGQQIGKVGLCGQTIGPHLHFEVMLNGTTDADVQALEKDPTGKFVNPKTWLELYGVSP